MFSGRLTKPYEYFVSFAHGFDNAEPPRRLPEPPLRRPLQFKVGRFLSPFTYEFYVVPIHALITPEWSLFFNNFGLNRDLGLMAWGQLARKRVDYAAGIFNGTRNGFSTPTMPRTRRLPGRGPSARRASGPGVPQHRRVGRRRQPAECPIPGRCGPSSPIPGNATIGVPFLAFNPDVRESGDRTLWSLHMAYYYRHLSLIGEWQSGFQDYAIAGQAWQPDHLPVQSFYVEAGYFLTGETVAGRGMVKPLGRSTSARAGSARGPGSWRALQRARRRRRGLHRRPGRP